MDYTAQLNTKFSQLGPLLIGPGSIFTPKHWNKSNINVIDETSVYTPVRAGTTFGQTARFTQPKRATLQTEYLLEITLSASTPAATAAYVNNLGDQILRRVVHRYGSAILHEYDGEYQQLWQRLTTNEVNEEGRNALTLGGLPLSVSGAGEAQRADALTNGLVLYVPLNRLWFSQHLDEAWMPEAYATEGELEITLQALDQLVYNAVVRPAVGGAVPSPFAAPGNQPTVDGIRLITREVTLTVPEKLARLNYYETDRGLLTHFLDLERQPRVDLTGTGGAAPREFRIRLDNIRLDMQEIFFVVRRGLGAATPVDEAAVDDPWSGDNLEAPTFDTSAFPATRVQSSLGAVYIDTMLDDVVGVAGGAGTGGIVSYRLEANGKRLFDDQSELVGRAWVRRLYHPDAQARYPIYQISFSADPENTKNVYSFQNAANLGNLELVLTMQDFPADQAAVLDVWVHSHNIIQSRRGDVVKSLK